MGVFRRGRFAVLAAVAGIGLMAGAVPASAQAVGGGAVIGSGTISPGLNALPAAQSVSFSGNLTGALVAVPVPPVPATATCSFSGGSLGAPWPGDSVAAGAGSVSGGCTGTGVSILASLTYARAGAVVAVAGTGTVNGNGPGAAAAICVFVSTQVPPITNYQLVCVTGGAAA